MTSRYESLLWRYQNNRNFKELVDCLFSARAAGMVTTGDILDAATFLSEDHAVLPPPGYTEPPVDLLESALQDYYVRHQERGDPCQCPACDKARQVLAYAGKQIPGPDDLDEADDVPEMDDLVDIDTN